MLQLVAGMAVMTNMWNEMPVQDFVFCRSTFNQLDQKACILTAELNHKVQTYAYKLLLLIYYILEILEKKIFPKGIFETFPALLRILFPKYLKF